MHATGVYLQTMSVGFKVAQTENYIHHNNESANPRRTAHARYR